MPPRKQQRRGRGERGTTRRRYIPRRRVCPFCAEKTTLIDYKDVALLRRFVSDRGKIQPRRRVGTCAHHQRILAQALKRARYIALLPYTAEHIRASGGVGAQV